MHEFDVYANNPQHVTGAAGELSDEANVVDLLNIVVFSKTKDLEIFVRQKIKETFFLNMGQNSFIASSDRISI